MMGANRRRPIQEVASDDDDIMESSIADLDAEEIRSRRIAQKEDREEELRDEERRKRRKQLLQKKQTKKRRTI